MTAVLAPPTLLGFCLHERRDVPIGSSGRCLEHPAAIVLPPSTGRQEQRLVDGAWTMPIGPGDTAPIGPAHRGVACAHCGGSFIPRNVQHAYCRPECKRWANAARSHERWQVARAQMPARPRLARALRPTTRRRESELVTCGSDGCPVLFFPVISSGGRRQRFCSLSCSARHVSAERRANAPQRTCPVCGCSDVRGGGRGLCRRDYMAWYRAGQRQAAAS